ncbi:MAG: hypothetical protein BWK76_27125 [Desulfobulbaceae bacterium A2]|nr:MAG: hypothetical protein BWK76_27125 [Desulfobulbaceae bacterium A2]
MNEQHVLTRDTLLLQGCGNMDFDIYKLYADETGDNFQLLESIVSGFPYQKFYGIPKISWPGFTRYLDTLRFKSNSFLRIIYLPTTVKIDDQNSLVYELTYLNYQKREIFFYSNEGPSWRKIFEDNFLSDQFKKNISAFCDVLNG